MYSNTQVTTRRFSLAVVVVALAALMVMTVGASSAEAAGYKWIGKYDNTNYYMCKTTSSSVKIRAIAAETHAGYSFRVQAKRGKVSTFSSGTTAALTKGNSSYLTVWYSSSDTKIDYRVHEWAGNQGGVSDTRSYLISAIAAC